MNPQGQDDPLDAVEAEESGVADRLHGERPHPSAAFRGKVRRRLVAGEVDGALVLRSPVPLIVGYLTGGAILLLVAAVGVAGIGPFAS